MANQELVSILRQGGPNFWNMWRLQHPDIPLDLFEADLHDINIEGAIINQADLRGADLRKANLVGANLTRALLAGADLQYANLGRSRLAGVDFSHANLRQSHLSEADLYGALLAATDLTDAKLTRANFQETFLDESNFSRAMIGWTIFGNVNLQRVSGLETVVHQGPSTIGLDTITRSQGNIPTIFLRGAGFLDTLIDYLPSLLQSAIQYQSCFISYASEDLPFAQQLYDNLQQNGVRCWLAMHDMRTGAKIRDSIDQAIQMHDKVILILSEQALQSSWVEEEMETALEKEKRQQRLVLFPIRLDDQILQTRAAWATTIRRNRHIGDFRRWQDPNIYEMAFQRLLNDLKQEAIREAQQVQDDLSPKQESGM